MSVRLRPAAPYMEKFPEQAPEEAREASVEAKQAILEKVRSLVGELTEEDRKYGKFRNFQDKDTSIEVDYWEKAKDYGLGFGEDALVTVSIRTHPVPGQRRIETYALRKNLALEHRVRLDNLQDLQEGYKGLRKFKTLEERMAFMKEVTERIRGGREFASDTGALTATESEAQTLIALLDKLAQRKPEGA